MKEPEQFERQLLDHFPLPMEWIVGGPATVVTEADLDADAQSFMAFAGAFGVKPPRTPPADPPGDNVTPLRSADSA